LPVPAFSPGLAVAVAKPGQQAFPNRDKRLSALVVIAEQLFSYGVNNEPNDLIFGYKKANHTAT